jgi:hypothetical protein
MGRRLVNRASGAGEHACDTTTGAVPARFTRPWLQRIEALHRNVGNQVVQRLFQSGAIQTKPIAGRITPLVRRQADNEKPDEEEEVVQEKRIDQPLVQRQEENEVEEPEEVQTKQASTIPAQQPNPGSRLHGLQGGEPLPASSRAFFEPRFGADFGHVRVHTGSLAAETAREINAQAFTRGRDIVFGPGRYQPQTSEGQRLLAHELTHVIQQWDTSAMRGHPHVQRKIRIAGADLDAAGVRKIVKDLLSNRLVAVVPQVGAGLIRETVREMQDVSDLLDFIDADAFASNVRHRVLLSHSIRLSQGSTKKRKAFSYPNSKKDGTLGTGPKVNDAAVAYWGPVNNTTGNYYFDLSPAGLANPYKALMKLFKEHTDPRKRTLIHCDYVVSVLELRAYAENIGAARFNAIMQDVSKDPGAQPMRLKYNGFTDLLRNPTLSTAYPVGGGKWRAAVGPAPLKEVVVASKNNLIIGDHVIFYNHPSYDALKRGVGGVWRLENAIVVDRAGGQLRYQGHGYFSPVPEDALLRGMMGHYNRHVDDALGIIHRTQHGKIAARTAAQKKLVHDYPDVKPKASGGWEVRGVGICGKIVARDLKHLTRAEAPGLKDPCRGDEIRVKRPVEEKP